MTEQELIEKDKKLLGLVEDMCDLKRGDLNHPKMKAAWDDRCGKGEKKKKEPPKKNTKISNLARRVGVRGPTYNEYDPTEQKTYEEFIKEVKGGTAVFTFGRFNPPTIGHEKLIKVVENTASKQRGDYFVFMSQSHDSKKNPLKHDQKLVFMKLIFPKHRRAFIKSKARNALEVAVQLYDMGRWNKLVMVVGSDRVQDFNKILNQYNGEKNKHGFYDFEQIEVISAGERDPDAEGVEGMSASKMRSAVKDGDYEVFKMGLPAGTSEKDCHNLYNAVAKGMNMKIQEEPEVEISQLIKEVQEVSEFLTDTELYEFSLIRETVGIPESLNEFSLKNPTKNKSKPGGGHGLDPATRRKMAIRMRLQAKKPGFIKKRLISLKKAASAAVLAVRARKAAIAKVVKKYYPKLKTKSKSELSYGERGKISDIVKKKAGVIMKMAKRLVKDKKKQDVERRRSMNKPKDK